MDVVEAHKATKAPRFAVEWAAMPNRLFWVKSVNGDKVVLENTAGVVVAAGVPVEDCTRVFRQGANYVDSSC